MLIDHISIFITWLSTLEDFSWILFIYCWLSFSWFGSCLGRLASLLSRSSWCKTYLNDLLTTLDRFVKLMWMFDSNNFRYFSSFSKSDQNVTFSHRHECRKQAYTFAYFLLQVCPCDRFACTIVYFMTNLPKLLCTSFIIFQGGIPLHLSPFKSKCSG